METIYRSLEKLHFSLYSRRYYIYAALIILVLTLITARYYFYDSSMYVFLQSIPDVVKIKEVDTDHLRTYVQNLADSPDRQYKFIAYKIYFCFDLLFPVLLFMSSFFLHGIKSSKKGLAIFLFFLALISILVDWTENLSFLALNVNLELLHTITNIKFICYGVFFIFWFYNVYQSSIKGKGNVQAFSKAILASFLSILIALIFAFLMTSMDQGTSLVIEMLVSPWNFFFFFFLIAAASVIVSHYPRFIYNFFFPSNNYNWERNMIGPFPIIYFNTTDDSKKKYKELRKTFDNLKEQVHAGKEGIRTQLLELQSSTLKMKLPTFQQVNKESTKNSHLDQSVEPQNTATVNDLLSDLGDTIEMFNPANNSYIAEKAFSYVRHFLGSFVILSIIYVLFFTYHKVFGLKPGLFATQIVIVLTILVMIFQRYLQRLAWGCRGSVIKIENENNLKGLEDVDTQIEDKIYFKYKASNVAIFSKTRRVFLIFNMLIFVQIGLLFIRLMFVHEWSEINLVLAIVQFICMLAGYIIFREFRSLLKYRYNLSKWFVRKSDKPENLINDGGIYLQKVMSQTFFFSWSKKIPAIGNFSNNEFFILISMSLSVVFTAVLVIFSLAMTTSLNAANYLLGYILLYYGLIIFVLKWIYFLERRPSEIDQAPRKSHSLLSYVTMVSVGLIVIFFIRGNDLHKLEDIPEKYDNHMGLDEFRERISPSSTTDTIPFRSLFSVASFGGGLKANYYTLKVLQAIQRKTNGAFLESTLSLSGVSGGGVGLANYFLMDGYMDATEIDSKIEEIGKLNVLSIDCSYLMFQDFWREIIPGFQYTDRSYRGMYEYKKVILSDPTTFDNLSYRDVHRDIVQKKGYYPTLLMNSTSTKLQYGIANSIEDTPMPGAIDILDITQYDNAELEYSSLNFYDAVSTVNRFPIFSPAAEIRNKGHFVDGGYFENSGILSSISFLDRLGKGDWAIHEKMPLPQGDRNIVIVNLINSKSHWINHILQEVYGGNDFLRKGNESTELTAIINTVTETEMLPNYFIQLLKQKTADDKAFTFIPIYMPYPVQYEDVVEYLKGEPSKSEELINILADKNKIIEDILSQPNAYLREQWGLVEPALSRNLSEPDRIYQDVMIENHPYILDQLDLIDSLMYK